MRSRRGFVAGRFESHNACRYSDSFRFDPANGFRLGCFPGFSESTRYGDGFHIIFNRPPAILDGIYNMGFDIMRVEISPNLLGADGSVNATPLSDVKAHLRQGR